MKPHVHDGPPRHNHRGIPGRKPTIPSASATAGSELDELSDLVDAVLDVAEQPGAPEALRVTIEKAMTLTDARHGTLGPPLHELGAPVLGTQIAAGAKVHARLVLADKPEGAPFTARDQATVAALARAAAIALEHACELGRAKLARRRLEIVADASRALFGGGSVIEALEQIAEQVRTMAGADLVVVTLPDDDGVHQIVEVAVGARAELVKGLLTVREGSVSGEVLRTGRARVFTDAERSSDTSPAVTTTTNTPTSITTANIVAPESAGIAASRFAELGVGPALVLPMSADSRVRAALAVCRHEGREPFEPWIHDAVAQLAHEAAQVVELADRRLDDERVQLYRDRERIARDLHDLVVQRLFGVCMTLEAVRNLSQRTDVSARVGQSIDELDDTIRQIRSTIFALQIQQPAKADAPLRHRIIEEIDAARQVLGFSVALRMEGLIDTDVPPAIAEHVIAVLREALTNVARHAHARRVEVQIAVDDRAVIEIVDDGLGPSASAHRSGLDNLARRAEQFGGSFTVEPARRHVPGRARGAGTRIRWQVPLR